MTDGDNAPVQETKTSGQNVIGVLLDQHAQIRELFSALEPTRGKARQAAFDDLRLYLAQHEAAEEVILRPVSREAVGMQVAADRNNEEGAAADTIAVLEGLDVDGDEFAAELAALKEAVERHAENEERLEFPLVLQNRREDELLRWGSQILAGVEQATRRSAVLADENARRDDALGTPAQVEVDPGVQFETREAPHGTPRSRGAVGAYTDLLERAREIYRTS